MEKLFTLLAAVTLSAMLFAQAPQSFSYQTVIRDANWTVLDNQSVGIKISILEDVSNGTVVYEETHSATTSTIGLVNLSVGDGVVMTGVFNTIDWGNHNYFIEVAVDVTGGSNFIVMGTTQLRSVPYALYAETSGTPGTPGADGADGIDGTNGTNGVDGADGTNGINGLPGADGTNGANGTDGYTPIFGLDYTNGVDGATGPAGNDGQDGTNGTNGLPGADGADGIDGTNGTNGVDGADGTNGINGLPGADGTNGANGAVGAQGLQGIAGSDGANGNHGTNGTNGADGAVGAQGIQGVVGTIGNTGSQGTTGNTGSQGTTGNTGAQGATGQQGIQGIAGTNGVDSAMVASMIAAAVTNNPTQPAQIGEYREGGIVFWIDYSGQHGLVCDLQDLPQAQWGCFGNAIPGADGQVYGAGIQNTIDILASCYDIGIAAALCASSTAQGYNDWFLPSKYALENLFLERNNIYFSLIMNGGSFFSQQIYLSSTENDHVNAWAKDFDLSNAMTYPIPKSTYLNVRAVRAF